MYLSSESRPVLLVVMFEYENTLHNSNIQKEFVAM